MSGGIAQLVAVGAQDVHLVGQPEVCFFRSTYKRHTNFPKLSSVRSFKATSQTTVCPPSASSARVTCSTMSTSFPTWQRYPSLQSSPVVDQNFQG